MTSICDIPVRVIALSDTEFKHAADQIFSVNKFSNVQRWNAVRGKDLFETDNSLRSDYRDILKIKYPQVELPDNVALLSPLAEKSIRYGEKNHIYDFHNAGAVGCALAHISLWQSMVKENIPAVIVFESDVNFATKNGEFCQKLQSIVNDYTENFDAINFNLVPIFYPLTDHTELEETSLKDVVKVKGIAFRTQGYLLTNAGARKLLQNAFPLVYIVDSYMTVQTILPSSNFEMIATKEPLLNHPLIVFDSSIGYSTFQCVTDLIFFIPNIFLVILMALFIILIIVSIVVGVNFFTSKKEQVFQNEKIT